jgi:hypothetical protein
MFGPTYFQTLNFPKSHFVSLKFQNTRKLYQCSRHGDDALGRKGLGRGAILK